MYQWNDQITNSGTAEFTGLAMGSGDDTVTNEASGDLTVTGDLNLKMGADTVANHGEMTVTGDITDVNQGSCGGAADSDQCGNSNDDTIINNKALAVSGDIVLGSGAPCTNCGKNNEKEDPKFKNWSDNDTLNNSGTLTVANINFEKQVATGTDADTLINSGTLTATGNITFGRDGDTLTNTGALDVDGGIDFGSGNDTFSTGYGFNVGGIIDGGSGTNALEFGEKLDHYFDGGSEATGEVKASDFKNWTKGYQLGGNWDFDGDFSDDGADNPRIHTFILRDGTFRARDNNPPKFNIFEMDGGYIDFVKTVDDKPSLSVKESFEYKKGALYIDARDVPSSPDNAPVWKVIEGPMINAEGLANNTLLVTSSGARNGGAAFRFTGLASQGYLTNEGDSGTVAEYPFHYAYLASDSVGRAACEDGDCGKDFDVRLVPRQSPIDPDPETEYCEENPDDPLCNGTIKPDPDPEFCEENPDAEECKEKPKPEPDPQPELPGCEDEGLCEIFPPSPDPEDPDPEDDEVEEIVDILVEEVHGPDPDFELPLLMDWGELARLIGSGLAPRNVDAAGRGLALYNNLLVDAVFDRQPLRQFEELLIAEEVVEGSVVEEEAVIEEAAPVQPLWLKSDELADEAATAYVEGAVAEVEDADAAIARGIEEEAVIVEFDGVSYVDLQDVELDLAKRDGVSAWVKGFGGNSRADDSSILYNDYDLDAYGTSFGVDVALSETFQIGAYANYGDVNVHHRSGDTGGGSWNPEGWGGGLTAQYSTRHFYVQGLLGASEFSGEQSRNILQINNDLGGNTAKGDKSVTSYLGALRIGAPFKTGGVVLEPQGQVVWTRNHEQGFSESHGTEKNLRLKYKSRTTNFAETELGMKLSVPIRTGDRALLVPSLRAAWLADWNQGNEGQEIGYNFTKKTVNFDSQLGTENGALLEAGLDYTVQNFNGISVKLYGRGGMEFWASDRGTTWRASGGVTFQF
ncbi:autotransporter domain-containing protein [Synechococcus sp. MU1617]|nr:autotransporter domain-containing protein [Synechococcus sp. MU1617]